MGRGRLAWELGKAELLSALWQQLGKQPCQAERQARQERLGDNSPDSWVVSTERPASTPLPLPYPPSLLKPRLSPISPLRRSGTRR